MADFGIISVTQLNEYIKHKLDGDFLLKNISVSGEISNCKVYSSGHMYFTLKDAGAALRCVMFSGYRKFMEDKVDNGDAVIVKGDISVYVKDGGYQLYVTSIKTAGLGALYEKYLELKDKLEAEGLFDAAHKKQIPAYPRTVGVVTSDSGAVYHDIRNVSARRFPLAKILLFPSKVQGEGAADELVGAIKKLDESGCDVAIIARGGGSLEDLWQFNNEAVVRAVYAMNTPVISAVGHETDFTLCDFAADLRAPTPSAAAELALPDSRELRQRLLINEDKLISSVMNKTAEYRLALDAAEDRNCLTLKNRAALLRESLRLITSGLNNASIRGLSAKRMRFERLMTLVEENNPVKIMKKGYAQVHKQGRRVLSAAQLNDGDNVSISFYDDTLTARIVKGEENEGKDI